jgi:transcriptional regulator with XRE-family HTH domain
VFQKSRGMMRPMKKETTVIDFGKRLAGFRKTSGLTQQQLGDKVGVSKRVIAYYEGETSYPPAHLVGPMAKALNVSTDELLGIKQAKGTLSPDFASLWRRLKVVESFSDKEKKALLQYVDIIADKHKAPPAQ